MKALARRKQLDRDLKDELQFHLGEHGAALAGSSGHGFATAGNDQAVIMFNAKTLKSLKRISAAEDADAIVYDAPSDRVFTRTATRIPRP